MPKGWIHATWNIQDSLYVARSFVSPGSGGSNDGGASGRAGESSGCSDNKVRPNKLGVGGGDLRLDEDACKVQGEGVYL